MTSKHEKLVKTTATVGLEIAKSFVPGSGAVLAVFNAMLPNNDAAFTAALTGELHDHVNRLQGEIDRLSERLATHDKRLDDLDLLAQRKVVKEYAEAVSEATGEAKRDSLLHAAARQFDPTA